MKKSWGYVTNNVSAMRAEPDGNSEQISQAIMGESVRVHEQKEAYVRVQTPDAYEGWLLESQVHLCAEDALFAKPGIAKRLYRVETAFAEVMDSGGSPLTRLVADTPVQVLEHLPDAGSLPVLLADGRRGHITGQALERMPTPGYGVERACAFAHCFLGSPYLWGGTTPFGFDCSGLVQRIYGRMGIMLPRDAYQQAQFPLGAPVPEGEALLPGDLVFFCGARDPRKRGITHVGMMLDRTTMVHAYGKTGVMLHPLDSPEIRATYLYRGAWRCPALPLS